ncbi:MAG: MFS transporter [Ignisphaera sp.]|nr:MFS transporter [Ignisphaera sp.]MCX8167620.1 MFS transporter [Ignisphaera sp.]MDW8086137.1 MFS transporter [Ignisphaera sp.]
MLKNHVNEVMFNVATLCFFISIHSISPYISRYAISLGAIEWEVALLGPALSVTAISFRPLSGFLIDRGKLKFLTVAGILSTMAAQAIYSLSNSVKIMYIGRVVHGLGVALFIPASVYTATIVGRGAAGALVWRSAMIGLAATLGPAIGGVVIGLYGYQALFILTFTLQIVSALLSSTALKNLRYGRNDRRGSLRDLCRADFITASISILCYSSMYNSLTLLLPAYHKVAGVEIALTTLIFTVISLFNLISRIILSALINRVRFHVVAAAGYGAALLGVVLIALNPASQHVVLYAAATGIGAGLLIPSLQVIALLDIEGRSRGIASGIYTAMFDVGNIIGPPTAVLLGRTYLNALKVSTYLALPGLAILLSILTPITTRGSGRTFSIQN